MKIFKSLFILFIAVSFSNCSTEDSAPTYPLTYENIAGTYNIQSLSLNVQTTVNVGVVPITSTANGVGDTFQVDLIMNQDRSYSVKGAYRLVTTASAPGITPTETQEIINVDESGTYTINSDNSIIFTDQNAEFLNGTLNVTVFNESTFTLTQLAEGIEPITNATFKIDLAASFIRK